MEGRMSRLRRSLSRSIIQLHSIHNHRSSENLADLPGPPMNFERKFATPSSFPELQNIVQNNNELLREIINVFEERANLDQNYAKSMYRLSARLHKVSQNAQGTIDQVWSTVADQYDSHATIHSNLGSSIRDDIVQPLKSIFLAQQKSIKKSWNVANRELRDYRDQRAEVLKTKNRLDSASRDLERIEQAIDNDKGNNIKLSVKKRKALDSVYKLEEQYLDEIYGSEKKRRTVALNLKRAARNLEHVEKQRLDHTQTALGRFNRTISQLAPSLNQMFEKHLTTLTRAAQCNPTNYIMSVEPSTSSHHVLYLGDFYAENQGEPIEMDRRRRALARAHDLVAAKREKIAAREANEDDESGDDDDDAQGQQQQKKKTTTLTACTLSDFLNCIAYKIEVTLLHLDAGVPITDPPRAKLYQQKIKDKSGATQSILSIPQDDDYVKIEKPPRRRSSSAFSSNDYDYERISLNENALPLQSAPPSHHQYPQSTSGSSGVSYGGASSPPAMYRVLYDFPAHMEEELDLRAGDCVIVEGKIGEDWMVGHLVADTTGGRPIRSGRFPASYVAA